MYIDLGFFYSCGALESFAYLSNHCLSINLSNCSMLSHLPEWKWYISKYLLHISKYLLRCEEVCRCEAHLWEIWRSVTNFPLFSLEFSLANSCYSVHNNFLIFHNSLFTNLLIFHIAQLFSHKFLIPSSLISIILASISFQHLILSNIPFGNQISSRTSKTNK